MCVCACVCVCEREKAFVRVKFVYESVCVGEIGEHVCVPMCVSLLIQFHVFKVVKVIYGKLGKVYHTSVYLICWCPSELWETVSEHIKTVNKVKSN